MVPVATTARAAAFALSAATGTAPAAANALHRCRFDDRPALGVQRQHKAEAEMVVGVIWVLRTAKARRVAIGDATMAVLAVIPLPPRMPRYGLPSGMKLPLAGPGGWFVGL
ncbi:MAG: hypothetical protein MUE94_01795 [Verrucomicrobia bacterium]|jgi:hypothetical protein|nr:hypothetical protein [Verrucomicrobiota bacterium]